MEQLCFYYEPRGKKFTVLAKKEADYKTLNSTGLEPET